MAYISAAALVASVGVVLLSIVITDHVLSVLLGSAFFFLSYVLTNFICFDPQSRKLRYHLDRRVAVLFSRLVKARQTAYVDVSFGETQGKRLYHWEVEKLVELILRDFVTKWYTTFSKDEHFSSEVQHLLQEFSTVVEKRLSDTDTKRVFCDLLTVALQHLCVLHDVGYSHKEDAFALNSSMVEQFLSRPGAPAHVAMENVETEQRYIRACLDCVCELGIPENFRRSKPAQLFLREVLCSNVIIPLVNLLSEPNFLMRAILAIFSKSPPERFKSMREEMQRENEALVDRQSAKQKQVRHQSQVDGVPLFSPRGFSTPEQPRRNVSGTDGNVSSTEERVPGTEERAPGTEERVPGTEERVPGSEERVPGSEEREVEPSAAALDYPSVDRNYFIMRNYQECENADAKFVGYTIEFSTAVLDQSSLEELDWSGAAGVSTPVRALTRFSDYEKLLKDWKEEALAMKDMSIMRYVQDLPYLEKTTVFSVVAKLPFSKTSQMDLQMLDGRRKTLECFLRSTWSHPHLKTTASFQYFLKTTIKRYQWHLGGGTQFVARRGKIKQGAGGTSSTDESGANAVQRIHIQTIFSSFLSAQLPVSYHLPTTPAQTTTSDTLMALSPNQEECALDSSLQSEPSELTASAVLVSTHIELQSRTSKSSSPSSLSSSPSSSPFVEDSCAADQTDNHRVSSNQSNARSGEEFFDFPDDDSNEGLTTSSVPSTSDKISKYLGFVQKAILSNLSERDFPEKVVTEGKLSDTLFCFATETSRPISPSLWLCKEKLQRALLGLCGGAMDTGLMDLFAEVTSDEEVWARGLFHLRHTLWPNGALSVSKSKPLSYPDQRLLRQDAAEEFKRFLPDALPYLTGDQTLTKIIEHGLDCLENPELNKHLLYNLVDVLMLHLMPELRQEALVAAVNKERA